MNLSHSNELRFKKSRHRRTTNRQITESNLDLILVVCFNDLALGYSLSGSWLIAFFTLGFVLEVKRASWWCLRLDPSIELLYLSNDILPLRHAFLTNLLICAFLRLFLPETSPYLIAPIFTRFGLILIFFAFHLL